MQKLPVLALLLAVAAPLAGAQSYYASFDTLPEGDLGTSFVHANLLFDDLDTYGLTVTPHFGIDDAAGAGFDGDPGFGPPNFLTFGSPARGASAQVWPIGSMTITPPAPCRSAAVSIWAITLSGVNRITLEASLAGTVVATDTVNTPQPSGWRALTIADVDFDQLRLYTSGAADMGAVYLAVDSVVVEASGPGTAYCTATPSSVGAPASISASGSRSVFANNLTLHAAPVPDEFGIFYFGPNPVQVPFGDGFRCVGGTINRLAVHHAAAGELSHALDTSQVGAAGGALTPGSIWNFQAWFRDPAAAGAGFNLSNGLEVQFTP